MSSERKPIPLHTGYILNDEESLEKLSKVIGHEFTLQKPYCAVFHYNQHGTNEVDRWYKIHGEHQYVGYMNRFYFTGTKKEPMRTIVGEMTIQGKPFHIILKNDSNIESWNVKKFILNKTVECREIERMELLFDVYIHCHGEGKWRVFEHKQNGLRVHSRDKVV